MSKVKPEAQYYDRKGRNNMIRRMCEQYEKDTGHWPTDAVLREIEDRTRATAERIIRKRNAKR